MSSTEPDPDVTPAIGAALAAPDGSLARTERDAVMTDLGQLLDILGLGNFARPESPHEVFQQCLAVIRERENAITWNTSCTSCARVLDSSIREHDRAARAEAALTEAAARERERIALVAEGLGAHYHGPDGQSAPLAGFLRGQQAVAGQLTLQEVTE